MNKNARPGRRPLPARATLAALLAFELFAHALHFVGKMLLPISARAEPNRRTYPRSTHGMDPLVAAT